MSFVVRAMMSTSSAAPAAASNTKSAALIFLHGLGDTPAGWSSLQFSLPQLKKNLAKVVYVFPPAPIIPISINGGAEMPGWFDLYDWPIGVGVKDDPVGKYKAVQQIEQCITEVETKHGIPRSRIVVGGFSQGGAIALLTAYHANGAVDGLAPRPPLAGCVSLSGWWTLVNDDKGDDGAAQQQQRQVINPQTPLFWAHGQYDDKVLFGQQEFGITKLKEAGLTSIESHQYPMGHESDPKEMEAMAAFLDKLWFEEKDEL
eukprot:scaffold4955_cov204-Amphora_coffeaeformis.AAC.4